MELSKGGPTPLATASGVDETKTVNNLLFDYTYEHVGEFAVFHADLLILDSIFAANS